MHRSSPISRQRPPEQGFTLVELLVTVTIAAILLALAAPNFSAMLQRQAVASSVESFMADLKLARSEAIKRGTPVELCGVATPLTTPPTCMVSPVGNADADWTTNGWMVIDSGNATVIKIQQTGIGVGGIKANLGGSQRSFRFKPDGQMTGLSSLKTQPRDTTRTADQQIVCINRTGRAHVVKGANTCA